MELNLSIKDYICFGVWDWIKNHWWGHGGGNTRNSKDKPLKKDSEK